MVEMWDERYSAGDYVYGTEPNVFFRQTLDTLKPGRLLLPADGEGRNGVYAATKGWDVQSVDFSHNARKKAIGLAGRNHVQIRYAVSDILAFPYPKEYYDAIALIFVHLPPDQRLLLSRMMIGALRPGGTLIIEAFSKNQLRYSSGGPRDAALLLSSQELANEFNGLKINYLAEEEVVFDEGPLHQGKAAVIKMVAVK